MLPMAQEVVPLDANGQPMPGYAQPQPGYQAGAPPPATGAYGGGQQPPYQQGQPGQPPMAGGYVQQQQQPMQPPMQPMQMQMPGYGATGQMQPGQMQMQPPAGAGHFWMLEGQQTLLVRQKFDVAEQIAATVGCPCIEFQNTYYVHDSAGAQILQAKEESSMLCRGCCKPNHELKLNWTSAAGGMVTPNVMTSHKKFTCNCCACADIFRPEVRNVTPDGTEISRSVLAKWGGGLAPKVETMGRDGSTVESHIQGPTCCVGGLVELCQDIKFDIIDPKTKEAIGLLTKLKPTDMKAGLKEAFGDADVFQLNVPAGYTAEQTATLLAQVLLLDYLFFEGGPPMRYNPLDNSCSINCCQAYCLGCRCPCVCKLGGNDHNNN